MENPHDLPEEIVEEIFLRLPTKSVGKCRCLSKIWNAQLSTSRFINLHRKTRPGKDLILVISRGLSYIVTLPMKNDNKIILSEDIWTQVFGSCNGLVLLEKMVDDNYNNFIVNPITRQQVQIPDPPSNLLKDVYQGFYGFGYDSSCDDYKVVKFSLPWDEDKDERFGIVEVYRMKTRAWKNVGYLPFECDVYSNGHMPFVNGAVHILKELEFDAKIVSLDLATESFHEIPLPKERKPENDYNRLVVLRGCLAIIDNFDNSSVDVWVMKQYGVKDSWVRFHIHKNVSRQMMINPVCFVGDEEILCYNMLTDQWFVYDFKKGIGKYVVDDQIPHNYIRGAIVFEGSLVSP